MDLKNYLFIQFKRQTKRDLLSLLHYFPNVHGGQGRTKPNLGAQNSILFSHMGGRDEAPVPPRVFNNGKLDCKWRWLNSGWQCEYCDNPTMLLHRVAMYPPRSVSAQNLVAFIPNSEP